jgi:hypothetical protein
MVRKFATAATLVVAALFVLGVSSAFADDPANVTVNKNNTVNNNSNNGNNSNNRVASPNISLNCVAINAEAAAELAKLNQDSEAANAAQNSITQDQSAIQEDQAAIVQLTAAVNADIAAANKAKQDIDQKALDAANAKLAQDQAQLQKDQAALKNAQQAVAFDQAALTQTINQSSTQNVCNTTTVVVAPKPADGGAGAGTPAMPNTGAQ